MVEMVGVGRSVGRSLYCDIMGRRCRIAVGVEQTIGA